MNPTSASARPAVQRRRGAAIYSETSMRREAGPIVVYVAAKEFSGSDGNVVNMNGGRTR